MTARAFALVFAVGAATVASAQTVRQTEIDAFVESERLRQHIPGLALAIVKDGKPLVLKGYGVASLERRQSVSPTTTFNIGSVSKQFFAAAILKLQDEGKLRIDDDLTTFFPDAPAPWKEITLRRLLSHTAGLPRELTGWNARAAYSEADWLRMAYATKLATDPGSTWSYSNAGYFILALVVSRASGRPWSEYMEANLFRPLGMNATRVAAPDLVVPFRADGYVWNGQGWDDDGSLASVRPSGAFVSTLADLARWEAALVARRLLWPATFDLLTQPTPLSDGQPWPYGLGWYLDAFGGTRWVHHGGSLLGFRAEYSRLVDKGLTVIVLSNAASANPESIAAGVCRRVLPELLVTRGRPRPDRDRDFTGGLFELLRQIADKGEVPDVATHSLKRALGGFRDSMRADLKARLNGANGLTFLREIDLTRFGVVKQGQRVAKARYYRLGSPSEPHYLTAYVTKENQVAFFETSAEQP